MSNQPTTNNAVKFIDLFAGIGGFHTALASFGAECVFASEFEPNASKVYALNHGIQPHGDITLIDPDTIPDHDILCGGFPCQPFSIAGNQKGFEDTRGTLFFNVAKIIDIKKPKVCILENVPNILTHDKGNTVAVIANTLKNLGYDVYISTLNSNRFNSAQSRNRAYFVAIRVDIATQPFKFPVGAVSQVCVADIKETGDSQHLKDAVIKQEQAVLRTMEYPVSKVPKIVRIGQVNQGGQGERIYHEKWVCYHFAIKLWGSGWQHWDVPH